MIIYFRCTSKEETVSGVERWSDCHKDEIVLKCWVSLQIAALPGKDSFIVLHDELNVGALEFMKESQTCATKYIEIEPHDIQDRAHTFKLLDILEEKVNERINNGLEEEIHYIVEDDYLHTRESLNTCRQVFDDKMWEHFVIPYDYPDRYTMDKLACGLMVGSACHWRTNPSATYTLMAQAKTWKEAIPIMRKHAPHNFTEEAFQLYPCISPVPGVATHLTKYHMTPIVDWRSLWSQL